jgi:polyhydroxybutyrate depolymerase
MIRLRLLIPAALLLGVAACGAEPAVTPTSQASQTSTGSPTPASVVGEPGDTITVPLGDRPFQLHIPRTYQAGVPAPLVVLLHGYTASGAQQEGYFKIISESDARGFLYAMPDGTKNSEGQRFWNATEACCNFDGSKVDDSKYLSDLINLIKADFKVDAGRVYLVGHSNGGYMSYRMACDHADQITAIASLAGAMLYDTSKCKPSGQVSVLQIHSDTDEIVPFAGSPANKVPSAAQTVNDWRQFDGCPAGAGTSGPPIDLDTGLPGAETTTTSYKACRAGTTVALWVIRGGKHSPALGPDFARLVIDWLFAQAPKA